MKTYPYYIAFEERNEHEGETWRFLIPCESRGYADATNAALTGMVRALDEHDDEHGLDVHGTIYTKEQVRGIDVFLRGDGAYMPAVTVCEAPLDFSKVESLLDCVRDAANAYDVIYVNLSAGAIRDLLEDA